MLNKEEKSLLVQFFTANAYEVNRFEKKLNEQRNNSIIIPT